MSPEERKQVAGVVAHFAALVREVDETFRQLKQQYSDEINCRTGCDDCCHAVFTISFVEKWAIEKELVRRIKEEQYLLARLREQAASFQTAKKEHESAKPVEGDALSSGLQLAQWRIRCPMLEDSSQCVIYSARPLTCRIYGLPLSIEGRGHVCGLSGFRKGEDYPTIKMEKVHAYLLELSLQLAEASEIGAEEGRRRYFLSEIVSSLAAG